MEKTISINTGYRTVMGTDWPIDSYVEKGFRGKCWLLIKSLCNGTPLDSSSHTTLKGAIEELCRWTGADLDMIFESIQWDRKFSGEIPKGDILRIFRPGQETEALLFFWKNSEETKKYCRAAFLFSDSLGQAIAVTEEKWENE